MILFMYDPNSFVVVYARAPKQIVVIWPQNAEGKPGDWQNEEHVRKL